MPIRDLGKCSLLIIRVTFFLLFGFSKGGPKIRRDLVRPSEASGFGALRTEAWGALVRGCSLLGASGLLFQGLGFWV